VVKLMKLREFVEFVELVTELRTSAVCAIR
jgi:hypothetical protein